MKSIQPPTIIIVLGATGDLMAKKITPALYRLFGAQSLPQRFRVVGFARRELADRDFREREAEILIKHKEIGSPKEAADFLELYSYVQGRFEARRDYEKLAEHLKAADDAWGMCSNKLFYLAVPPSLYPDILKNLHATGLTEPCGDGPDDGWTRVIVEKPFGRDEKSAKALDALLSKLFKEEQIYRIDHYLAKESFQNVLVFRFFNNLFENNWGRDLIESIAVRELENVGVEDRGPFYDPIGALRDVGQNHLLQMLALVAMDEPRTLAAKDIRANREAILRTLEIPSSADIWQGTFRAQYKGYRQIKGVEPDSETETYFRIKAALASPRWRGVDITMEAGKRLMPKGAGEVTEIEIVFRHPPTCLCPPGVHYKDSLTFHQDPKEGITIRFWAKKPGHAMEIEERTLTFESRERRKDAQYTEEYEKLLLDCIAGDQALFVSSGETLAMWRFIDPITAGWTKNLVPLRTYEPDSHMIRKEAEQALSGPAPRIAKEIAIAGLGKMGANIARRLVEKGWIVLGWNRTFDVAKSMEREGIRPAASLEDLAARMPAPRIVWLMVPAGNAVDEVLFGKEGIVRHLKRGDIIVDGGNSFYEDSIRRAAKLKKLGIRFADVGVSGGPAGARNGASLMVGGEKKLYEYLEPLFYDLALSGGYGYMGKPGAGHFIKMVHNGIEYGMMQALAEGFAVIKKSRLAPSLEEVARVYGKGSVITSRLVDWLRSGFETYGDDLKGVSGSVAHTGEGEWTVKTAKKLGVPVKIIEDSFAFRVRSSGHPSYIGQILMALRNQFGGHSIKRGKRK